MLTWADFQTLHETDICPICRRPLTTFASRGNPHNKTLDRFDPTGPYSRENCTVICYRCNALKNNATVDELIAIGEWMLDHGLTRA